MSENLLINKYKKLLGIDNIVTTDNDVYINGDVTISSNLFVSNDSIINNNIFVSSSSIITGNSLINGNISITNNLNVTNNTIIDNNISNLNDININNNATILNMLNVYNDSYIEGNVTISNNLYVKDTILSNGDLNVNNIYSNGDLINITADVINIGNNNTIINLNGTTINILSKDLYISDKLISLNYDSNTDSGIDIGNDSGLIFYNNINNGYIKTNNMADRFLILPPGGFTEKYIATIDMSNNLIISGNSSLNGDVTINNILNVLGDAYFNNNLTINNNLNLTETLTVGNNITSFGTVNISYLTQLTNNITVGNNMYVSNTVDVSNNVTLNSKLNVENLAIINGNMTVLSNINVMNDIICNNDVTILSSMMSNNVINNNNLTVGNKINVITDSIMNNVSVSNTLYVTNNTIVENNVTINSNLYISGNSYINGSTIFGNRDSITTIMGNLYTTLSDYDNNQHAISAGMPLWALYRTGGIIKVVIHEISPIITFLNLSKNTTNLLYSGIELIFENILQIETHPDYPITTIDAPSYVHYQYPGGETTTATALNSTITGDHILTYNIYDYFNNLGIQTLSIKISNVYYEFIVNLVQDVTHYTYNVGFNDTTLIRTYTAGDATIPDMRSFEYTYYQTESIKSIQTFSTDSSFLLSKYFLNSINYDINNTFTFLYKVRNLGANLRWGDYFHINFPVIPLNYFFNDDDPAISTQPRHDGLYEFDTIWNESQIYENSTRFFRFGFFQNKIVLNITPSSYPIEIENHLQNISYTFNIYSDTDIFTITKNTIACELRNTEVTNITEVSTGTFQNIINFNIGYFMKLHNDIINNKFFIVLYDNNGIKRIETIVNNIDLSLLFSYRNNPSEVDFIIPHSFGGLMSDNLFYEGVVYFNSDITTNIPGCFPSLNTFS